MEQLLFALEMLDITGRPFQACRRVDALSQALAARVVRSMPCCCGENGAGKSTLIKILGGVDGPDG